MDKRQRDREYQAMRWREDPSYRVMRAATRRRRYAIAKELKEANRE